MARQSTKATLVRQWRLMELVRSHPQGQSMQDLMQELKISKVTLDSDLKIIEEADLPFTRKTNSEETRVLYSGATPSSSTDTRSGQEATSTHAIPTLDLASALSILNEAIENETQVHVSYILPGTSGVVSGIFAPLLINTINEAPYLLVWNMKESYHDLFEVARITWIRKGEPHQEAGIYDEAKTFADLAETSLGELITVKIRTAPWTRLLLSVYPLAPTQSVKPLPEGGNIVECKNVATLEALRWTLSWGSDAEVLEPKSLRALVAGELRKALAATLRTEISELTKEREYLVQNSQNSD